MTDPATIEVTRELDAPPDRVWALLVDVPRMPALAPGLSDTRWAQGSTGPAVGAVLTSTRLPAVLTTGRGLIRPAGRPRPDTWFCFRVTRCQPGRVFEFENVAPRGVTATGYRLEPLGAGGTTVSVYSRPPTGLVPALVAALSGRARIRRQRQELRDRLGRIRAIVEGDA